jgi:hypothetical protein
MLSILWAKVWQSQYWRDTSSESGPKDTQTTHMNRPNSREKFGHMWDQKTLWHDCFLSGSPKSWRYGTEKVWEGGRQSHEYICGLVNEWKWIINYRYRVTYLYSNFISLRPLYIHEIDVYMFLHLLQDKPGCEERNCSEGGKRDPIQCIPFATTEPGRSSRLKISIFWKFEISIAPWC